MVSSIFRRLIGIVGNLTICEDEKDSLIHKIENFFFSTSKFSPPTNWFSNDFSASFFIHGTLSFELSSNSCKKKLDYGEVDFCHVHSRSQLPAVSSLLSLFYSTKNITTITLLKAISKSERRKKVFHGCWAFKVCGAKRAEQKLYLVEKTKAFQCRNGETI